MKKAFAILALLVLTCACIKPAQVQVTNLKCEYKVNPLGVDIAKPRFSWILESAQRGVKQKAYHLIVASSLKNLEENVGDIWDSQNILSDQTIQVVYGGKPLESNRKYYWKVQIQDQNGQTHPGEPAFWTTGLLHDSDWKAKWIGLDKAVGEDQPDKPHRILSARMLRHEFNAEKKVKSATAFVSGLGLFEFYLNGQKIGDQVLAPALSEYNKRAFYITFDVTKNIQPGKNAMGLILGNGRYFGLRGGPNQNTRNFGFPKVVLQLEIQYEDGTTATVLTDESWKLTADGPIRKNNEYDGEFYDARKEMNDWNKIGFDDSKWQKAEPVGKPGEKLVAMPIDPIEITDQISPVSVKEIKPGTFIFDLGQNMVGWTELTVKGKKGDQVTQRFAETLKPDGSLFLDNIRNAEVTDTYILKGEETEKWEPRFTYHGFRFVEMTGFPGTPALTAIKGKVVHDALETTGTFNCSNPLINSIYKNAVWGISGNYRSMPTDCPQRDERQGWLGDRSAECTGESFIFDISKLYNKWVNDMHDAQLENGSVPDIAPTYWPTYTDNTTWPGTFLFASDMLYNQYGDTRTIETHYPALRSWITHMSQYLNNGIMPKDTYGDWCVPPEDLKLINSNDPLRITSAEYIGTAYFSYELRLMAKFARLLGKEEDAAAYEKTSSEMKVAFNKRFFNPEEVTYSNNTCTVNILALAFDLVPAEYREKITDRLLQKILGENSGHVGNGIIGGQWLMRTLTETGHADVAYVLAAQKSYPGWGYMVEHGATTIWELWNGDHGDPGMNSGNHVMLLGDLIIWYYQHLAGIQADPAVPAFRHIIMKPYVLGDLIHVDASYNSISGPIKSSWKLEAGKFKWAISVPANTTATVYVPTLNKEEVLEGTESAHKADGVQFIKWEDNRAVFEVKSGDYTFTSDGAKKITSGTYVTTPIITPSDTTLLNGSKLQVKIACTEAKAVIHYSVDGSEVTESSAVYSQPIEITRNTTVRTRAFIQGAHSSNQARVIYNFVDPKQNGIRWWIYNGAWVKIPDLDRLKPEGSGVVYKFGLDKMELPKANFALRLQSNLQIDKAGKYTFIDGKLLINNDGEHGAKEMSNSLDLTSGKHQIRAEYFQSGGGKVLSVLYSSDEISHQPIPESILFK